MLAGFATALTLVLLEIVLRYAPVPLQQLQALEGLRGCYRVDAEGLLETVPGWSSDLTVDDQTHTIHINSIGLRGPEVPAPVAGEQRILMLGDSFVMGYGVGDDETIPAILEAELNRDGGPPVRIGNAGMLGTGPREWAHTLARFQSSFDPTMVVACCYAGNDPGDTMSHPLSAVDGWLLPGPVALLQDSSWRVWLGLRWRTWLFLEVNLLLQHWPIVPPAPDFSILPPGLIAWEGYFLDVVPEREQEAPWIQPVGDLLKRQFTAFREQAGSLPVLVVVLPGHEASSRDKWREGLGKVLTSATLQDRVDDFERGACSARIAKWAEESGLTTLDLTGPMLALEDSNPLYLPTDYHYSAQGCRQVAEWMLPAIETMLSR